MKKYSVYVLFKGGQDLQFETDSNVKLLQPQIIDGARFIVTENEYVVNLDQVEKLEMIEMQHS